VPEDERWKWLVSKVREGGTSPFSTLDNTAPGWVHMDECLAGPGEPLSIHLSQVAECVRERGAAVARKLAKVYNMSIEEAEDLLVSVAYAHDVGKTDVEYRDAVDTFRRHEAKSTAAAYEAMRKSEVLKDCKNLDSVYAAALVAVAMHHYVHKEPRLDIDVRGYRRRCRPPVDAWQPKSELGRRLRQALLEVEEAGAAT